MIQPNENATETPKLGDVVAIHFHASLPSGKVFETSEKALEPLKVPIGNRTLIRYF